MVTSMLEKAIEIEGLLRIIRDGDPLPETYILLNIKTAELAEQASCLEEKTATPKPESADFVMAEPTAAAASAPQVTFTVQQAMHQEEKGASAVEQTADFEGASPTTDDEDLALIEEDDILLTFEEMGDFSISSTTGEENVETASEEETPQADPAETPAEEPEEKAKEEPEEKAKEEPEKAAHPKRQTKLKAAFSLNDRFLYSRELFEGNMKMFDSTLEFLEGVDDYSVIEDYFYSELEWDPENSHVAAFMDILRPNFKEL